MHWAVELARFVLAAGGGERSERNMLQWFLLVVPVRTAWRVGGKLLARTAQKLLLLLLDAT
jgi:hypothetical protein